MQTMSATGTSNISWLRKKKKEEKQQKKKSSITNKRRLSLKVGAKMLSLLQQKQ